MEAKCAKMPPTGSKLTEALKTWQNSLSKFAYWPKSGEKKNSVTNSIFRNSTHKYHIWYRISHFRGGGLQYLDDFVGNDPTQTSEVKKILMQHFLTDIKNCTSITVASATT